MKRFFRNMSLLRKLTLAYTIVILIPTIAIGYYTYCQSMNDIKRDMIESSQKNLLQIKEELNKNIELVEGIGNNIAYNDKIQNLLEYGMKMNAEELNYYIDSIVTPIDNVVNLSDANIYQIGVYYVNNTIPEYNSFFNESRLKDQPWLEDFKNGNSDRLWVYPAKSKRFKTATSDSNMSGNIADDVVLKMVQKIRGIDGRYLGIITIDMLEDQMFLSMHSGIMSKNIFAATMDNQFTYPRGYSKGMTDIFERMKENSGHFFDHDTLYSYQNIIPLKIRIISRTSIKNLARRGLLSSGYNIMVVAIGLLILEVVTYFLLKMVFMRLNQIVKIMSMVARGNFDIRIPIVQQDEVGQISQSFNTLIEKINSLIHDLIKKETAQKDAQITALQYQINPHFIYNTIDIFRMKLEIEGNYEMADSVTYFGKMLRYNIKSDTHYATIGEELDYIDKYIHLQKLRYKDRIIYCTEMEKGLEDMKIIRFMLQPIVENCIKHGIGQPNQQLTITIKIKKTIDRIYIYVIDNGRGINRKNLERINSKLSQSLTMGFTGSQDKSIGLLNINTRIRLFYGDQYFIRLESTEGEETSVIINIPIPLNEGDSIV